MRNMCLSKLTGDWPVTFTTKCQHSLGGQEVASFYGCHSCWFPETMVQITGDPPLMPEALRPGVGDSHIF